MPLDHLDRLDRPLGEPEPEAQKEAAPVEALAGLTEPLLEESDLPLSLWLTRITEMLNLSPGLSN